MMPQNDTAIKIRELHRLTRLLASRLLTRRGLRKKLARVEDEIRGIRCDLKTIVEDAASAPGPLPLCSECYQTSGSNPLCNACQALRAYMKGEEGFDA